METARKLVLVVALLVLLVEVSNAQTICNVSANDLLTCKPAVTKPNPAPPTQACCSVLARTDLGCLCKYKNSNLLPSLGIDPNLAVQLPAKCHLPRPANC